MLVLSDITILTEITILNRNSIATRNSKHLTRHVPTLALL